MFTISVTTIYLCSSNLMCLGAPVFSLAPENQRAPEGVPIEIMCRAEGRPSPSITWRKDGRLLEPSGQRHYVSSGGSLYLYSAGDPDVGRYECLATNEVGSVSGTMQLTLAGKYGCLQLSASDIPNEITVDTRREQDLRQAAEQARAAVERAVNRTVDELFGPGPRRPTHIASAFRFPLGVAARRTAQAGEVFELTLRLLWEKVGQSGMLLNTSAFTYENFLSEEELRTLAGISGCLPHQHEVDCSDLCYHRYFFSLYWLTYILAVTHAPLLPQDYGFCDVVAGWDPDVQYNGHVLPGARRVSTAVVTTAEVTPDPRLSGMVMQWGQFLDHDLDFSMPAVSHVDYADAVDCRISCKRIPPCFPIEVPRDDPRVSTVSCMEFFRSSAACGSGLTSAFMPLGPTYREQLNQLTSFLDASHVYGSNDNLARHLRQLENDRGLLRSENKKFLPQNDGRPVDCKREPGPGIDCFLAGDHRANEQLGLLSMHTLWMREHNRLAREFHKLNPHWDGETIYQEVRKLVGAQMQHITYQHWLPQVLGPDPLESYQGYNSNLNPSIANSFATAALRFGHTLIQPFLARLDANYQPIPEGHLPLRNAFFAPNRLVNEGGIDPLLRGLLISPAKLPRSDQLLNSELTEQLFSPAHLVAQDLAALNIQRGRDHGLPSYSRFRARCNLTLGPDLGPDIRNPALRDALLRLYGHPDNIDLWVGGVSEEILPGAKVGPTFHCLLRDQFRRIRDGDRLWYEADGTFPPQQLQEIRRSSLAAVLCDNGDNFTTVSPDVFLLPEVQGGLRPCSQVPRMDLTAWLDCPHGKILNIKVTMYKSTQQLEQERRTEFFYLPRGATVFPDLSVQSR
ncbi:PXDN [Cordylochernes scorpioides]|uniref:PXDN n=1 Tax=Cordylochernes scorpioides TaxID=51811 RepID=A0ABY6K6D5_9ARAC|nr:PXDN [Cordylochernes scorpioides]